MPCIISHIYDLVNMNLLKGKVYKRNRKRYIFKQKEAELKYMKKRGNPIDREIYEELFPRSLSRADLTKLRIIEAAINTYSELGIDYVSYEDIARTAKLNRPLINHHFPDKHILFEVAMKFVRAKFQELAINEIRRQITPEDQLKAYVKSTVNWAITNPTHVKAWVFFFYQCMSDSKLRSIHSSLTSIGADRLVALLESGGKEGLFSKENLSEKAKNIQRVITGALLEITTECEINDVTAIQRISDQTVSLCLAIARSSK